MQTDQLWTHPGKCCVGDIGLKMVLWGRKRMEQHLFGDLSKGSPEEEIFKGRASIWRVGEAVRGWAFLQKKSRVDRDYEITMERSVVLWEWWGLTRGKSLRHEDILEEGPLSGAEMKTMPADSLIPALLKDSLITGGKYKFNVKPLKL